MKKESALIRFNRNVRKTKTCWIWPSNRKRAVIYVDRKPVYVSRFSYETFIGTITDGLKVLHTCDNPHCCNPDHLFLGTQLDNMKDMVSKGRSNKPKGEENGNSKLSAEDVRYIRKNYKFRHPEFGQKGMAKKFNVGVHCIYEILRGVKWSHIR